MNGKEETTSSGPPGLQHPVAYRNTTWTLPSNQVVIRRYMGFEWFEKTIEDEELYFGPAASYADDDPKEGQVTEIVRNSEQRTPSSESLILQDGSKANFHAGFERLRQGSQSQYFLSCWRLGTDENGDHWEKFGTGDVGVAIETTVGQLWQHIRSEKEIFMGMVRYIDRESDKIPNHPPETYFFKGRDYSWENEFRLALVGGGNPVMDIRDDPDDQFPLPDYNDKEFAPFAADDVINRVVVEPDTNSEQINRVQEVLSQKSIEADVDISFLNYNPEWCPSCIVYGNQDLRDTEENLNKRLKEEVESTDWSTYETVDWVQIVPHWAKNGNEIVGSHFEVHRYEEHENLPKPSEYGHDRLLQYRRISRFSEGEYIDTWDIDPEVD